MVLVDVERFVVFFFLVDLGLFFGFCFFEVFLGFLLFLVGGLDDGGVVFLVVVVGVDGGGGGGVVELVYY